MLVAALFAWLVFTATASANALPVAGIYQVWGNDSGATAPYVRGGQITLDWATIEPQRNTFNWSSLDSELKYYASIGKVATVQVNSTTKPAWLWNVVARCGTVQKQAVPQYWDPVYMTVQTELVSALATHLKASPYASTVALVRSAPNAIGTELTDLPSGYTCTATPSGHKVRTLWSKDVRSAYYYNVMNLYRLQMLPQIPVALRAQVWTQWPGHCPTTWLGSGGAMIMGTGSDIDPQPIRDAFDLFAYNQVRMGSSNAYWEPISYAGKKNLVSWNYWRILLELDKGVRSIAVYGNVLSQGQTNPEFRAAFDFANAYAGHQWDPAGTPGAWVALRQGTGRMAGQLHLVHDAAEPVHHLDARRQQRRRVDDRAGHAALRPLCTQGYGRHIHQHHELRPRSDLPDRPGVGVDHAARHLPGQRHRQLQRQLGHRSRPDGDDHQDQYRQLADDADPGCRDRVHGRPCGGRRHHRVRAGKRLHRLPDGGGCGGRALISPFCA